MKLTAAVLKVFVCLSSIDPSIQEHMLYGTSLNFTGAPVIGYEVPRVILTRPAAEALKKAQAIFKKKGYSLVVYDGYRPKSAQDFFKTWSIQVYDNPQLKSWFYPDLKKETLFEKGYIPLMSGHSSGSSVDCTLIELGKKPYLPEPEKRNLTNGEEIVFLNDGTLDMGTCFDFFGAASWTDSHLIGLKQRENRQLLCDVLTDCGFINYPLEWWHFDYKEDPFPGKYFDFSFQEITE